MGSLLDSPNKFDGIKNLYKFFFKDKKFGVFFFITSVMEIPMVIKLQSSKKHTAHKGDIVQAALHTGLICLYLPVVPHKAVAEVSRIGNYRRDWLL